MVLTERTVSAGKDDYQIHLNFLPVETEGNTFIVYRRKRSHPQEQRPAPGAIAHKLPVSSPEEEKWTLYWVVPEEAKDFEPFHFQPEWNGEVTKKIIFASLRRSVEARLSIGHSREPGHELVIPPWLQVTRIDKGQPVGAEL